LQYTSCIYPQARSLAVSVALLVCAAASYGADTYNGAELTSPTVVIGAGTYSNMVVTPSGIVSVHGGAPNGSVDSYDPSSNRLSIPSVVVGTTTYTNVIITVNSLISIGSVSGADTFNGTYVLSPVVQVKGGPIYNDVVFAVGTIVSLGGGMPHDIHDVYDPGTHQVTLAAIQVGNKVYTNPIVTLGNYVTAGGTGIPVPNVVGDAEVTAGIVISSVGLTVGTLTSQLSSTVAAGKVISESPPAGAGVVAGTSVNLVVSAGATGVVVPNVVDGTQAAASSAITAAGLTVGAVTTQASDTVTAGDVISESPTAGTHVAGGSAVNLLVSSGSTQPAESLLYSFAAPSGNTGGYYPGVLIQAKDNNLYGVTQAGGTNSNGTVFKLTLGGTESLLYTFPGGTPPSGYIPDGLVQDSGGINFYGTSDGGGTYGGGTLYQLTPAGAETTLYNFCGCLDNLAFFEGVHPGGLLQGGDGNFYGTTVGGQDSSGTVFVIPPSGIGGVLYFFRGGTGDGDIPVGNLIAPSGSDLYGATVRGGTNDNGIVFSLSTAGVESILYNFGPTSGHDAQQPIGGLVHANGKFYGMTAFGGDNNTGAVYSVTQAGLESVVYSFPPPVNSAGANPIGSLILASDGNLYGATTYGGIYNIGMIFKITPSGTFSVVHSFSAGGVDAAYPAALIQGADGNLYGSARAGGANLGGAIFKIVLP